MENKQKILDLLLPSLQSTRHLHDLESLQYMADKELVKATFRSGTKHANVGGDSGISMIRDLLNQIV